MSIATLRISAACVLIPALALGLIGSSGGKQARQAWFA
jgi:hypothetical protein